MCMWSFQTGLDYNSTQMLIRTDKHLVVTLHRNAHAKQEYKVKPESPRSVLFLYMRFFLCSCPCNELFVAYYCRCFFNMLILEHKTTLKQL